MKVGRMLGAFSAVCAIVCSFYGALIGLQVSMGSSPAPNVDLSRAQHLKQFVPLMNDITFVNL